MRQSLLKLWQICPLQYRYSEVDGLPREQSSALTFGSLVHHAVLLLETTGDLEATVQWFKGAWADPAAVAAEYEITEWIKGTSYAKYARDGEAILRDWWSIIRWESDTVLAREYSFRVPIGEHHLVGTIDKLALRHMPKRRRQVVLVSDYKTNRRLPTYEYLGDDLQFTAYCYATTQPGFWTGIENGEALYEQTRDWPRYGEWVALKGPKRMDAGERTSIHYNRLEYAVNMIAESVALRIFPPNISGASCRYCSFRSRCGLNPIAA